MFRKYQWFNVELQKKYKKFYNITLGIAILALICLYLLPGNLKMLNVAVILVGFVTFYMTMRIQSQDKNLRKNSTPQTKK